MKIMRSVEHTVGTRPLGVIGGLLLLSFASLFIGCQTPSNPGDSSLNVIDSGVASMPGVLREGDVIQITFSTSSNLNTTARIPLDGQIVLQFVDKVAAAGKTPVELARELERLYLPQLRASEPVTVTVVTSAAVIYVAGAVLRPGKIPLDRPFTVLDAIMEAGGVDNTRAKLSGVTVLR